MSNAIRLSIAVFIGASLALGAYTWSRLSASPPIVRFSGRVTLNGQPLPNAYVKFSPVPRAGQSPLDTNAGSHDFTDDAGNFTLIQIENDRPGVIMGQHKVAFRTGEFRGEGYEGELVPFSWRTGMRSFYVPWTGAEDATFCIQTISTMDVASTGR
jgi:hypothetical protein